MLTRSLGARLERLEATQAPNPHKGPLVVLDGRDEADYVRQVAELTAAGKITPNTLIIQLVEGCP